MQILVAFAIALVVIASPPAANAAADLRWSDCNPESLELEPYRAADSNPDCMTPAALPRSWGALEAQSRSSQPAPGQVERSGLRAPRGARVTLRPLQHNVLHGST
ncbi:MAG: hypothetical protein ABI960_09245 [Candidatus Eisenbacteria bacterium]